MTTKIKMYPIGLKCPECGETDNVMIGCLKGLPFSENHWYMQQVGASVVEVLESGVANCKMCGKEYYYKLEHVPAAQVFKMTEVEPTGTITEVEVKSD